MDFREYQDLADTGPIGGGRKKVDPKDEIFKSLYIAGVMREDETTGVNTQPGTLQIRGLTNNLTEVHMIITHIKNVLVNEKKDNNNKMNMVCFSFQSGPRPWYGTSGKMCGANSNERSSDSFCQTCRSQIIMAGIYCTPDGKPILNEDGKPEFIFVRGKGVKYGNVSEYIYDLSNLDLEPFFDDDSQEARSFEKTVVNHKRFITKVTTGTTETNYGKKFVYNLERGDQVDDGTVKKILSLSKKTLDDFNEKFDWSKTANFSSINYDTEPNKQSEVMDSQKFESDDKNNNVESSKEPDKEESKTSVSFDDIDF